MKLQEHLLYGGMASVAISPFFGWKSFFFFVGSVFIDLDHYCDFVYFCRFRKWKLKDMFHFHGVLHQYIDHPDSFNLEAYHTIEFFLLLAAVAFCFDSVEVGLILGGGIAHLGLDLFRFRQLGKSVFQLRALSFVQYWWWRKKMVKLGKDPEMVFKKVREKSFKDLS